MNEIERKGEVVSFFSQHIIPIYFSFQKEEKHQEFIITSFLFSVSDYWFLLTAGHCFKEIEEKLLKNGWFLNKSCMIDCLGLNARFTEPIPFPFKIEETIYFPDFLDYDLAYDYGLYPLSEYYRKLLLTNNVKPLNEEVWKKESDRFDLYVLVGIPSELIEYDEDDIEFSTNLFYPDTVDFKPAGFSDVSLPQIYAKIHLNDAIRSIEGMSGGPLFGLRKNDNGELRYWLVGLLSRWLPESHYIAVCPTKYIGKIIESLLTNND